MNEMHEPPEIDTRNTSPSFLAGGGEMGALMRAYDWAQTPLGPPESWPQSLKSMVRLLLTTRHPMFIFWGPRLVQFYNDAYRQTMGPEKHPAALGGSGYDWWAEAWAIIGPQIERVMAGEGATWNEDQLVPIVRHGREEDVFWTYGYSPIDEETAPNGVGGVLVVCNDVTERHLSTVALREGEERLRVANASLAARIAEREQAEAEVRRLNAELEARVEERTEQLSALMAERESLLEAERSARAEAEIANRLKDDFLATLSHELRAPLSVIVTWGRLLELRHGGLDEKLKRGLGLIVASAMAQAQIISDLLDVSAVISGKVALEAKLVDAVELVAQATSAQRPAAEAKGITLLEGPYPASAAVLADPTRLQQVLWNLLSNAIKFTPAGGRIAVETRQDGAFFELSIRDTGEGIEPAFLPHLFDRFRQADRSRSRFGGLGLGLAIVKQLAELHGGQVRAESEGRGRGATFTVRLPVHTDDVSTSSETTDAFTYALVVEAASLEGLRVLAVEDQPTMLEYTRRVLEEQGAAVITATSGEEALGLIRASGGSASIDVLVSDIGMPGMDGYKLMRTLRNELCLGPDKLGAVAVTAFARKVDRSQAIAAGFRRTSRSRTRSASSSRSCGSSGAGRWGAGAPARNETALSRGSGLRCAARRGYRPSHARRERLARNAGCALHVPLPDPRFGPQARRLRLDALAQRRRSARHDLPEDHVHAHARAHGLADDGA